MLRFAVKWTALALFCFKDHERVHENATLRYIRSSIYTYIYIDSHTFGEQAKQ